MTKPDHSKIGKSNVRRGKSHERTVAKLLTDWSGVKFRRRRNEGRDAITTDIDRTGDVIPGCAEWCHFNIEVKCGANPTLDALFGNPEGTKITEWYHQSTYDSKLATESYIRTHPNDNPATILPLLFYKPSKNHNWIIISEKCLDILRTKDGKPLDSCFDRRLPFSHMYFDQYKYSGEISMNVAHTKNKKNEVMIPLQLDGCFFCRWKDFAEHIDPRSFFIRWPAENVEANPNLEK